MRRGGSLAMMAVARKTNGRTDVRPFVDFAMFLNETYFDFFCVLLCFFAMALLLECAPTRRNSGALQMNTE
jgi:hypothetical protein